MTYEVIWKLGNHARKRATFSKYRRKIAQYGKVRKAKGKFL